MKVSSKSIFSKSAFSMMAFSMLAAFSQAHAANLVTNGSFEAGNTGFSSAYAYQSNLGPAGTFYIDTDPNLHHPGFAHIAAQDGSNMMILNGSSTVGSNVWAENGIAVQANTTYYFSTWVASATPGAPANLQFSINGANIGQLDADSSSTWQQFYATWNSGSNTVANIALVNLNTAAGGNDFVLDNIVLDTVNPTAAVPEPGSVALAGLGLAGVLLAKRRRRS